MKYILAALAIAAGSWMGQFIRTAATVPDEAPPPPEMTPGQLLPSYLLAAGLSSLRDISLMGTILLAFNSAVIYSFLLGRRADRAWIQQAQKG